MRYAILWYEMVKPKKKSKRKKRITKLYNNRSNPFKYSRIFYIVYSLRKYEVLTIIFSLTTIMTLAFVHQKYDA